MDKNVTYVWYELCNSEGHALVLSGQENNFRSEDLAAEAAAATCIEYRDVVLVVEHSCTALRKFEAQVDAVEV